MILKEAFRYSNYLKSLMSSAKNCLIFNNFTTTTTVEHMRSVVNPDADDEIEIKEKEVRVDATPDQVLDFAMTVLNESEKLAVAIADAKKSAPIDIDSSVAMNVIRQDFENVLNSMNNTKASESTTSMRGFKFNADGNEVSYTYKAKVIKTIDFNRNTVKKLLKKVRKEADETSTKIDQINLTVDVKYEPIFDLNDSFDDAIDTFLNK